MVQNIAGSHNDVRANCLLCNVRKRGASNIPADRGFATWAFHVTGVELPRRKCTYFTGQRISRFLFALMFRQAMYLQFLFF